MADRTLGANTIFDLHGQALFGQPQKMPIRIAPTGTAGPMWHEGELALALG